jgi:alpha-glucosidase (family GH31 glycosyl hydrolase)
MLVVFDRRPFSASGFTVQLKTGGSLGGEGLWRYGYKYVHGTGLHQDNLGGTARTLDEADGRIDMGEGILSTKGFASIDDSNTTLFTDDGWFTTRREGDRVDGYLFMYGLDYKEAIKAFYAVSGPQALLPRWAFGNWWSRYYPYSADEYLELMDKFKREGVPLSVAVIDMDWHRVEDVPAKFGK